jgi:hypothetical protein
MLLLDWKGTVTELDQALEVQRLLSDESRWTQKAYSRDKFDFNATNDVTRPDQVCWCSVGAIAKVQNEKMVVNTLNSPLAERADRIARELFGLANMTSISGVEAVVRVNDKLGYEAVTKLWSAVVDELMLEELREAA